MRQSFLFSLLVSCVVAVIGSVLVQIVHAEPQKPVAGEADWRALFDGKTLSGWKKTNFGGENEVYVENQNIVLEAGYPLTGITFKGDFPKTNYDISLEAQKVDGIDFFCGLTFPVADSHCSFIVGGWAGGVVGISSIDGKDASENETTTYMKFDPKKWYKIRVRVTADHLAAWIDDKQIVDQSLVGRKVSTRAEVDLSTPLGISTFETKAFLRRLQYRPLKPTPGNTVPPAESR